MPWQHRIENPDCYEHPSLRNCLWRLYELAKDNEDQPAEAEEEGAVIWDTRIG